MPLTLEQHRVQVAYATTEAFLGNGPTPERQKNWKTAVMDFGTQVQRCGLLQAVAFLKRDADQQVHQALLPAIRQHLITRGMLKNNCPDDLFVVAKALESRQYMLVSREVLALSAWVKRATQSLCKGV